MSLLRSLVVAACLLACAIFVSADCGIGEISLSSLSNTDWTFTDSSNANWLVRPCSPTTNSGCLKAGAQTSSCQSDEDIAYGFWTTELWHKWSFLDPSNPSGGVQLYMEGSAAPSGCNEKGVYYSWILFPCDQTAQGNLTVVNNPSACTANFTIPTPLTCRSPLEISLF